jgi:hypothetical protein
MARSRMTCSGLCHFVTHASLAAVVLVVSIGCGAPSSGTATNGAGDLPDQVLPGNTETLAMAVASAETKASDTPAKVDPPTAGDAANESVGTTSTKGAAKGVKLTGRVTFQGPVPARRVVNMGKDAKCVEIHGDKRVLDEELIVSGGGGVENAFVSILRGAPKMNYPMPEQPAVLDQKGCMYHPRVQGVRIGQRLLVANDDPVTHNVRSFPVFNRAFNFGQPPDTEPRERVFERAERAVEVQCDFHSWMHAYIFVMDHPFFDVSKDDGTYAIVGLPPGEYTLEAWHEKLGRQRKTITVSNSDLVDVSFMYKR